MVGRSLGRYRVRADGILFLPLPPCEVGKVYPHLGPMPANLGISRFIGTKSMSDLASTQPATRPLGTGQRTWRCGGFLRWRPGARLVMMQGQKSRTTEAYLRILYWTWGIGIAIQS